MSHDTIEDFDVFKAKNSENNIFSKMKKNISSQTHFFSSQTFHRLTNNQLRENYLQNECQLPCFLALVFQI